MKDRVTPFASSLDVDQAIRMFEDTDFQQRSQSLPSGRMQPNVAGSRRPLANPELFWENFFSRPPMLLSPEVICSDVSTIRGQ